MHATFCALQQHGYAGLSIQRIADEAELSKSTFYHHFDGKEDLLLSFLEFILDTFDQLFQLESSGDPHADLKTFVSLVLGDFPHAEELPDRDAALRTYVELRAHAVRTPSSARSSPRPTTGSPTGYRRSSRKGSRKACSPMSTPSRRRSSCSR
ncbi:TetR/AcrR family transcriptional regulator [Halomicroarcula sp. GCM10025709]|uniref:TetR/AcrR family transcriptional regulator n=1 Tax=Halomicroarcula sp. GCM10025709 TaxID=3252669 RepID=UPI003617D6EC